MIFGDEGDKLDGGRVDLGCESEGFQPQGCSQPSGQGSEDGMAGRDALFNAEDAVDEYALHGNLVSARARDFSHVE